MAQGADAVAYPGANSIALLAIARASDQAVLAQYADKAASAQELQGFEAALGQLLQKASKLPAYPGWRDQVTVGDKLDEHSGSVYVLADKQAMCVVAVAVRGQRYPERLAQGLLDELIEKVRSSETDETLSEAQAGKFRGAWRATLKDLVKSYNDPASLDKVSAVHEKVDKVKGLMQDNVKKILETHVSLETLQTKSCAMSASADQFLKQSVCLKRQIQLRNLRVKVLVAGCSCALGAYFIVPLCS